MQLHCYQTRNYGGIIVHEFRCGLLIFGFKDYDTESFVQGFGRAAYTNDLSTIGRVLKPLEMLIKGRIVFFTPGVLVVETRNQPEHADKLFWLRRGLILAEKAAGPDDH